MGRFVLFNHKLFSMAKRDNKVTISTSLPLENWKQSRHTMRVWSWTLISCYTLWRTFFVLSKKKKKRIWEEGGFIHLYPRAHLPLVAACWEDAPLKPPPSRGTGEAPAVSLPHRLSGRAFKSAALFLLSLTPSTVSAIFWYFRSPEAFVFTQLSTRLSLWGCKLQLEFGFRTFHLGEDRHRFKISFWSPWLLLISQQVSYCITDSCFPLSAWYQQHSRGQPCKTWDEHLPRTRHLLDLLWPSLGSEVFRN